MNIDWPSTPHLDAATQKAEFIYLLDSLQSLNINAVIVQIRPVADAFYPSPYEPWSEYLNGVQGLPPLPFYDPLKFMIEEAHKRNMEFHAWLNPYRAVFDVKTSRLAPTNITRIHPEWFVTYGTKKYFNPALPEVMQYVTRVVKDIISRYDVDAIHMDDYFYPYRIAGKEFSDAAAFRIYGKRINKDDWRRSNCDSIIKMLHEAILSTKPMVKFGISPFGVWRNSSQDTDGSNTKAGQTNYDDLYADILLWLKQGWIDYVAPQLYWENGHPLCDYKTLLDWWGDHSFGKHVYIGQGVYKAVERKVAAWRNPNELPTQVKMLRNNNNVQGSIYYNCTSLLKNPGGWADSLQTNYYRYPALIPPMPWIDTVAPQTPVISNVKQENRKHPDAAFIFKVKTNEQEETETVKSFVLYMTSDYASVGTQPYRIITAGQTKDFQFSIAEAQIPAEWQNCYVVVTSVDRENNESALSNLVQLTKTNKGWVMIK